jgi:hypothetical protein
MGRPGLEPGTNALKGPAFHRSFPSHARSSREKLSKSCWPLLHEKLFDARLTKDQRFLA